MVVVVVVLGYPNVAGIRESPWRPFLFVFFDPMEVEWDPASGPNVPSGFPGNRHTP